MNFARRNLLALMLAGAMALPAIANEKTLGTLPGFNGDKGTRGLSVEAKIRNDHPAYVVRVDVDRPDRVYEAGELVKVKVVSEKDGYLYLIYKQADGSVVCLFPNEHQRDNQIKARRETVVPAAGSDFNLRVGAPLGDETLVAIVSQEPLKASDFGTKSLVGSNATAIDVKPLLKAINVELKPKPQQWAEHHVQITTVTKREPKQIKQRIGLFIGISRYQDRGIRPLRVCGEDAEQFARAMLSEGKLDGAIVLTNESATLAKIQAAFDQLVKNSRPGDEMFVYWSGHGGRCADDNGDETDGDKLDEYLVPFDTRVESLDALRSSVLLDDTFGRMIQQLDGRKVAIIIDACHAGGQWQQGNAADADKSFAFYLDEDNRTKDIGQKDAAMLLSSQANETSKERRDGTLSVMTYFLKESLSAKGQVTLEDSYKYLKPRVVEYVNDEFPGSAQTPILSNSVGTIVLRP